MDSYLVLGLLAVFVGLLFVQSRNRKKQAAQLQEGLKPGSEVMLTSGIIGVVDAVAGDRVVLTTAGSTKLEVASGAVMRILSAPKASTVSKAAKPPAKSPAKSTAAKKPGAKNGN